MVITVSWSSFKIPKIITSFPLKFVSILILFWEISKYAFAAILFENKIIIDGNIDNEKDYSYYDEIVEFIEKLCYL